MTVSVKKCAQCVRVLPAAAFYPSKTAATGLSSWCRSCQGRNNAEKYERNRERIRVHHKERYDEDPQAYQLAARARRVGISVEELKHLIAETDACRGCGSSGPFVVDHCHETKKFRGLLCSSCNLALGMVKDNPDVLRQLASYLEGAFSCR